MYAPLAALSSFGGGVVDQLRQNELDQATKLKNKQAQFEMQGLEALGRTFQGDQGPMPPMPGQPSMPAQPMGPPPGPMPAAMTPMPGPPQGGMPPAAPMAPGASGPPPAALPGPSSPGEGAPPAAASAPQAVGGMPQMDLPTLVQRIVARNPNLPPQAMVAAVNSALPMLTLQGKQDVAKLQAEMKGDILGLRERLVQVAEGREGRLANPQNAGGLLSPDAIEGAAERYLKTGQLPPNLGRGVQGRTDMSAIQSRAAEMAKEQGIKPADMPKNWQTFKAEQTAITRFMSGPQGNTIRSLSVVVDHLSTMQGLADALKNGDLQIFNRLANEWAAQTGSSAPTNLDTAKQIVGSEIIKALGVAGAGTQAERQEAAAAFSRAKSPEQLAGAIKVAQQLLGGQLKGLKRQFVTSTGLKADRFDELLDPAAIKFLGGSVSGDKLPGGMTGTLAPGAGWSIEPVK